MLILSRDDNVRVKTTWLGASIFLKKLNEVNIPKEAIVNKERFKLADQEVLLGDTDESMSNTPTTSRKIKSALSSSGEKAKRGAVVGWQKLFG